MSTTCRTIGLFALLQVSSALAAQGASSPGFFLSSGELGAGGSTSSSKHTLTGSCGSGVVAQRSASTAYALVGGFVASLDTPVLGDPWVTGVRPLRVARDSDAPLAVHGTELQLGTGVAVKVGGRDAAVTSRTRDRVQAVLPRDVAPGWQAVAVTAGGKTSTLGAAVGVLPMVEVERPAVSGLPFQVTFHGIQGDLAVWLLAVGKLPFRVPVAPYGHGFGLDLATLIVLGVTPVTDPQGRVDVPFPGVPWSRPLHLQAIALSQGSYRPGSFTNVIGL